MPLPINNHNNLQPIWPEADGAVQPNNPGAVAQRAENTRNINPAPPRHIPVTGAWRIGLEAWVQRERIPFKLGGISRFCDRRIIKDQLLRANQAHHNNPEHDGMIDLRIPNQYGASLPPVFPGWMTGLRINCFYALRSLPNSLPARLQNLHILSAYSLTRLPNRLPNHLRTLEIHESKLTHLPNRLPPNLENLNVADNHLHTLPGQLPPKLNILNTSKNQLRAIPDNLPRNLTRLVVSHNQLTSLPDNLPRNLTSLDLMHNQLQELNVDLFRRLPRESRIYIFLSHNPLSAQTVERLRALQDNRNYSILFEAPPAVDRQPALANRAPTRPQPDVADAQPVVPEYQNREMAELVLRALPAEVNAEIVHIRQDAEANGNPIPAERLMGMAIEHMRVDMMLARAMADEQAPAVQAPQQRVQAAPAADLAQAAAAWAMPPTPTNMAATSRLWQGFADEPGAPQFTQFLNRLRQTVNANEPAFQRSVAQWLTQLESNPNLREDTFAAAIGATESCEDRISLTYNTMRKLSMAASVSRGDYDQRLPELITLARGMFRLEQLEKIARETTATLVQANGANQVDEIEVYLGYQVSLRERLALPVETANMAYFRISGLTQNHLDQAEARVQVAERLEFVNYLSTNFAPWQEVIQRLAPELHEQAQDQLIEAMGNEFTRRMNTRLRNMALLNEADAERTMGSQVRAEIEQEVYGQLSCDFLASQGMLNLLR